MSRKQIKNQEIEKMRKEQEAQSGPRRGPGAAGGAILCAESLVSLGYIQKK